MARIKLGPLVTDIAGSIGGLTIQRSKWGLTARQKPLPLYSQTEAQNTIRRLIVSLQYSWQALSDAQRLQWDRFLDFSGQTIRRDRSILLSGQTLYIKYQLFRLMAGESLLTTISYLTLPSIPNVDTIRIVETYFSLDFLFAVDHTEFFFQFFCTNPRSPSKVFSTRGLRYMNVGWQDGSNFDFKASYIAAFGVGFSVGDTIHYTLQWFSVLSPVYSGKYSGTIVITV